MGFRVWGLGLGFRVSGLGLWIFDLGFRTSICRLEVQGFGTSDLRASDIGLGMAVWILGFGLSALGVGLWDFGC